MLLRSLLFLVLMTVTSGCQRRVAQADEQSLFEKKVQIRSLGKSSYLLSELPTPLTIPVQVKHSLPGSVTIQLAEKSCSCIGVKVPEEPVEPEKDAQIDVLLHGGSGQFSHVLLLDLCRPGHDPIRERIDLKYAVYEDVEIVPNRVIRDWSSKDSAPIELRFTRRGRDEALAKAKLLVTGLPNELDLKKLEDPKLTKLEDDVFAVEWKIGLTWKNQRDIPAKRIGTFTVGLEGQAPLTVQYDWIVSKRLVIAPQGVYFGGVEIGGKSVRRCVIGVSDEVFPAIKEVRSTNPCFGGSLRSGQASKAARILEVWFSPNAAGLQEGVLTVVTDATDEPELRVTVSGFAEEVNESTKK